MDLLEYMRSQNNMTQAEWEHTFEEEEREILVLLAGGGGAGKRNGFWDVSHYFIAYVPEESSIASVGRRCTASRHARRSRKSSPRA